MSLTKEQIQHMVDRFLGWRLPEDFNPDAGISYTRPNYAPNVDATPSGTNLLDAMQANAMVRYMIEGMPPSYLDVLRATPTSASATRRDEGRDRGMSEWQPIETAPRDGTQVIFWDSKMELAISGQWHSDPGTDNPSTGYEPAWAWWVSSDDLVMWDGGPDDAPTHWMPLPPAPQPIERFEDDAREGAGEKR